MGHPVYTFPSVYENKNKRLNELFLLTVRDPCNVNSVKEVLNPKGYKFLVNGSLYQYSGKVILPTSYCLAIVRRNTYDVIVCDEYKLLVYLTVCLFVSLPFFLLTFIVYSILPELQNMHGYTLRAQVASLFIMYAILFFQQIPAMIKLENCLPLAYIFNFSVLSSFLWLNISCFDIWRIFRGLNSNKRSSKQNKKRFVIYSFYAWGIPLIHSIICAIMDYVPGIPESLTRPEICKEAFWINRYALIVYIYIPVGVTMISNICFFVTTTLTILYQKKRTAQQLSGSESQRHNEKQRFNMYLKLFILMGITWIMEIIADFIDITIVPSYVWYATNAINALQGVIIFIIFVCTKKNMQLLRKQFGGWKCNLFCKIPTINNRRANDISTSPVKEAEPMREINSSKISS